MFVVVDSSGASAHSCSFYKDNMFTEGTVIYFFQDI